MKRQKNGRIILSSNCAVCDSRKLRFIKEPEPSVILINLGIKRPLSQVPILAHILFWSYKINEIVTKKY